MKRIFILAHDYWHHEDTIHPLADLLEKEGYEVIFSTDPKEFTASSPDVLISFKDPIENDQIPTPVWCDEDWTDDFMKKVENGMGFIGVHAMLTDYPENHIILKQIVRGTFLRHPHKCPLSVIPVAADHPVMNGVETFQMPDNDEQYFMDMQETPGTKIIAYTSTEHGEQPAVWVHSYGRGNICCITPGHTKDNIACEGFVQIIRNAIHWVVRS